MIFHSPFLFRWTLAPLVAWAIGCGGALPPAPTTKPIEVAELIDEESDEAEPAAAPRRPESLVASVRLSGRARMDASDVAWVEPLARLAKDVTHQVPIELLGQLDPDAPIDVAVVTEVRLMRMPRLTPVTSAALRSVEGALAALRSAGDTEVSALPDGRYRLARHHDGECLIAPHVGQAAAQIVCARRAADVERAFTWLVSDVASKPMPAGTDLEVTVYGDAVRHGFAAPMLAARAVGPQVMAEELRRKSPIFADLLEPVLPAILDEGVAVLDDFDVLTARAVGDATKLRVSLEVSMRSKSAWTSRTLEGAKATPGSSPVVFWRMPKDAHTAWFIGTQGDHAPLEQLRAAFARSSERALTHFDPSLRALITDSFIPRGTFAYASGFASERLVVATDPGSPAWIRREVMARFGWHIAGLDTPMAPYADYLDKAVDAYNRGPIRNLAYGRLDALCAGMPKITKHPLRRSGWPKGAYEYEMAVPGSFFDQCASHRHPSSTPAKPLRGVIVVIPDGDRTWLGLTLDPPALYARMEEALKNTVPAPPSAASTLVAHSELDLLRENQPLAGGFITLSGLAMLESNMESARRGVYTDDHLVVRTRRRADGGMTPIPISWSAGKGDKPTLRAEMLVPRAAVD